jgi:hypothetical protein
MMYVDRETGDVLTWTVYTCIMTDRTAFLQAMTETNKPSWEYWWSLHRPVGHMSQP